MKPNFLVFMTDHQRGDMQPPHSKAITPNLDRLYQNGMTFTESYCPSPHCCPSRATFFSGLYPSEHGVWNNVDVSNCLSRGLYENVRLFPEDLKENGYQLFFSGKWHLSAEQGPDQFGFEVLFHRNKYRHFPNRAEDSEWNRYERATLDTFETVKEIEGQIVRPGYTRYVQYGVNEHPFKDEEVVAAAEEKLNELNGDEPFFLYVGPLGPHDPYCVPQRFLDLYPIENIVLPDSFLDDLKDKPRLYQRTQNRYNQLNEYEHRQSIRHYLAFCTYEDYLFGRLLDKLKERNLLDNTYVLYVSDHGDYVGSHGLWAKGLPCFREAYHICSTIGYGGIKSPKRTEDAMVSLADWAPTILDLAGITPKQNMYGRSLRPFIEENKPFDWRDTLFTQSNGNEIYGIQRAVFDKHWKYVFNSFDFDELYNLDEDPNEMHNLAEDPKYQPIILDMCKKMWQFARENRDNCVNPYIMTALAPYGPGIIK